MTFDSGDVGLGGVTVTLSGIAAGGAAVSETTTTDQTGHYCFSDLLPGAYQVADTNPSGYAAEVANPGSTGGVSADADTLTTIPIVPGADSESNNFGKTVPAKLCGVVYSDANADKSLDTGDAPLGSVTVTLSGSDTHGNPVSQTTSTNSSGQYCFTNLPGGTYTVTDSTPPGYTAEVSNPGSTGGTSTNADTLSSISLPVGGDSEGNNFGKIVPPGSICGVVYKDSNTDHRDDGGDSPIGKVKVALTGTTAAGATVTGHTTTDGSGEYCFSGLAPGTYQLKDTNPSGYTAEVSNRGSIGGASSGPDRIESIALSAGGSGTGYDFGKVLPAHACIAQTMSPTPGTVLQGGRVTYTLKTSNCGNTALNHVQVCATLSAGVTITNLGGGTLVDGMVCWRIPRLAARTRSGEPSKTFRVSALVSSNTPPGKLPASAEAIGHSEASTKSVKAPARTSVNVKAATLHPYPGEYVTG